MSEMVIPRIAYLDFNYVVAIRLIGEPEPTNLPAPVYSVLIERRWIYDNRVKVGDLVDISGDLQGPGDPMTPFARKTGETFTGSVRIRSTAGQHALALEGALAEAARFRLQADGPNGVTHWIVSRPDNRLMIGGSGGFDPGSAPLTIEADGSITATTLRATSLLVGTNAVWHAGNFNPAGKLDSGSAAVSAAQLTTPRTLTVGTTGKAFDGTANVAWSLAEIGALAAGATAVNSAALNAQAASFYTDIPARLGFTPYNATNPSGFQTAAQVASSLGAFLPLTGGTMTGLLSPQLTTGAMARSAVALGTLEVRTAGGVGDAAFMCFHRAGFHAAYFGLDTDNQFKVGGWSMGAVAHVLLHAGNFNNYVPAGAMQYTGWITTPGADANTFGSSNSRTAFTYANNAPAIGPIASFHAGGYDLQLNASYVGGGALVFRTRNGDTGTWNAWRDIWHAGNFNPANKLDTGATAMNSAALNGQPDNFYTNIPARLGFTPYNATNPSGFQTAAQVTAAIGAGNALTATRLQTARTINGVSFDGTANITLGATDSTKLPLSGGTLTGPLAGTSATFTGAARADRIQFIDNRTIADAPSAVYDGLHLDFKDFAVAGSPPISANPGLHAHILSIGAWTDASGGRPMQLSVGDGIAFRQATSDAAWGAWRNVWHTGNLNPASYLPLTGGTLSGALTATGFTGPLAGNASTATSAGRLTTARLINGTPFDGTADITITAGGGTFLPLTGGSLSGNLAIIGANSQIRSTSDGSNGVLQIFSNGATTLMQGYADAAAGWFGVVENKPLRLFSGGVLRVGIDSNGLNVVSGALAQGGNPVWHAGNFQPSAYLPLAGGTVNGVFGVVRDGAGSEPYGAISVTRSAASNWSYYGLTRAGLMGMALGIDTSNRFIIGSGSGGAGAITNIPLSLTMGGRLTAAEGLAITDNATALTRGALNALRISTTTGFVDVGSMNASHTHFVTDRPTFYFNKDVRVEGSVSHHIHGVGFSDRFWAGFDSGVAGSVNASAWFRSLGDSGWYSQTYGGGIWMTDSTWVRTYASKGFLIQSGISSYGMLNLVGDTSGQEVAVNYRGAGQTQDQGWTVGRYTDMFFWYKEGAQRMGLLNDGRLTVQGRVHAANGATGVPQGNGLGRITVSTGAPTGGAQGDIWCVY